MRRSYAALAVAITCVLFTVGTSSSGSGARIVGRDAPKLLTATATDAVAQQFAIAAPSPQLSSGVLGAYSVLGVATMLAAALLCYALLQRRRAATVRLANWVVRLRGPPISRVSIVHAP